MHLHEAWEILGRDVREVVSEIKSSQRSSHLQKVEEAFQDGKKRARILMAKHHPDVGGDPEKFKKINEAISTLEKHTIDFRKEFEMKEKIRKELQEKAESKHIRIG
jgi:DnaJ-class molecular chaperone